MKAEVKPSAVHRSLVTLLVAMALAGCAGTVRPLIMQDNYLTYEHALTDAAALSVQRNAEKMCAIRKQSAIKTRSVCSLKECITHYQCVDNN